MTRMEWPTAIAAFFLPMRREVPPRPWRHQLQGVAMPEIRKRYDREFREGAVRIIEETGKFSRQVARDLGVNEGTLGNWVAKAREAEGRPAGLSRGDIEEVKPLRAENAELRMRLKFGKRSAGGW